MDVEEILFVPVGIAAGLAAGALGRVAFDRIWGLIDEEEPPEPEHRDVSLAKLAWPARCRARSSGPPALSPSMGRDGAFSGGQANGRVSSGQSPNSPHLKTATT